MEKGRWFEMIKDAHKGMRTERNGVEKEKTRHKKEQTESDLRSFDVLDVRSFQVAVWKSKQ